MAEPQVAVVIPARIQTPLQLGWFREALESLRAQTFRDFETVVVDDASEGFDWQRPSDVKLIRNKERRGPGACRNIGVKATSAPWLLAFDADDILLPNALADLYAARCEYEIVYGDINWIGTRTGYARMHDYGAEHLRKLTGPMLVTALHSRKAWRAVGGWTEELEGLEDLEYWIKLAEIGVCGRRIETITLNYRVHEGSRTAGLMADNKRKLGEVSAVVRDKHRPFMGGSMPQCATCPGSGAPGEPTSIGAPPPGMVELKYVGLMQGSFSTAAGVSRTSYRVEGRGAHIHVHAADAPFLLSLSGANGPEYIRVERQPPPLAPQLFAQQEAEVPVPPEAPAEQPSTVGKTVRELTAIIADTNDVMDLRIWKAEEESSDMPRVSVLKAIDKRLEVLLGKSA